MSDGVWKRVQSQVIGRSDQLSLNKFLDQSTTSMRKGRDGENGKINGMENNGENSGPLTTLPVDRLKGVVCSADARAKSDSEGVNLGVIIVSLKKTSKEYKKVP